MTVRVVHFSDLHGKFQELPEADLYVSTGDMLPDEWMRGPDWNRAYQGGWMDVWKGTEGFRPHLGSPDAPIVCVRGNHDFVELAPLFRGCNLVHEFLDNELVEVCGLRVTGHRGVPYINGMFSDELHRPDLTDRIRRLPDADLVLTHYPPAGVLDGHGYGADGIDLQFYKNISGRGEEMYDLRPVLHCFGHVHEDGGRTTRADLLNVIHSNAATTFNVIDL